MTGGQSLYVWKMVEKGRTGTYNRGGGASVARAGLSGHNGVRPASIQTKPRRRMVCESLSGGAGSGGSGGSDKGLRVGLSSASEA